MTVSCCALSYMAQWIASIIIMLAAMGTIFLLAHVRSKFPRLPEATTLVVPALITSFVWPIFGQVSCLAYFNTTASLACSDDQRSLLALQTGSYWITLAFFVAVAIVGRGQMHQPDSARKKFIRFFSVLFAGVFCGIDIAIPAMYVGLFPPLMSLSTYFMFGFAIWYILYPISNNFEATADHLIFRSFPPPPVVQAL